MTKIHRHSIQTREQEATASSGERKKTSYHRPVVTLCYALLAITAYLFSIFVGYTAFISWHALPYAAIPLLIALVFHNLTSLGSFRFLFTVTLNAMAAGWAVSAYFRALTLPLPAKTILLSAILLIILILFTYPLATHFQTKKQQTAIFYSSLLFFIFAITACVLLWCNNPLDMPLYALLTFHLIFFGFYYLSFFVTITDEEKSPAQLVSFWSFSLALFIALLAGVVIAAVLGGDGCDCDCSDGCDCADCDCATDLPWGKKKEK